MMKSIRVEMTRQNSKTGDYVHLEVSEVLQEGEVPDAVVRMTKEIGASFDAIGMTIIVDGPKVNVSPVAPAGVPKPVEAHKPAGKSIVEMTAKELFEHFNPKTPTDVGKLRKNEAISKEQYYSMRKHSEKYMPGWAEMWKERDEKKERYNK